MGLRVGVFEDDKEVAEILTDMMSSADYIVTSYYNIRDKAWHQSDIILADYNNKIVPFNELVSECHKHHIAVIAISGGIMNFSPQLMKPFGLEELQSTIFETLMKNRSIKGKSERSESWLSKFFKVS